MLIKAEMKWVFGAHYIQCCSCHWNFIDLGPLSFFLIKKIISDDDNIPFENSVAMRILWSMQLKFYERSIKEFVTVVQNFSNFCLWN